MSTKWFSYHLRLTHRPLFSIYIVSTSYILFLFHFHLANLCKCAQNNHIFFQVDPRSNKWTTHLLALSALSFSMHPPPPSSHTLLISSIPTDLTIPKFVLWGILYKSIRNQMGFAWSTYGQWCEGLVCFFLPPSPKRLHVCESNMAGVWPDKKHIQSSSFYKQTLHRFSRKKANMQSQKFYFLGFYVEKISFAHIVAKTNSMWCINEKTTTGLLLYFFFSCKQFIGSMDCVFFFQLVCYSRQV